MDITNEILFLAEQIQKDFLSLITQLSEQEYAKGNVPSYVDLEKISLYMVIAKIQLDIESIGRQLQRVSKR